MLKLDQKVELQWDDNNNDNKQPIFPYKPEWHDTETS